MKTAALASALAIATLALPLAVRSEDKAPPTGSPPVEFDRYALVILRTDKDWPKDKAAREVLFRQHLGCIDLTNCERHPMPTFLDLEQNTSAFFRRHWVADEIGDSPPRWKPWKEFLYSSVPNHDKAGCYALVCGQELMYVGLGASKGGGIYDEHGLSRRLMAHVICADRERGGEWSKLQPTWSSITGLYTIGFAKDSAYLAASLETYLIRHIISMSNARV
jgi:hypothetical protein